VRQPSRIGLLCEYQPGLVEARFLFRIASELTTSSPALGPSVGGRVCRKCHRAGCRATPRGIVIQSVARQQKQALKADEDLRTAAIHNDKENFIRVLEKYAHDAIVDRHESNGQLFNAYFEKPGFRDALLGYLADAYEEIREEQPA